ncbi:cytochrome P450-cam [Luminiphilus syltensis NOR5-1B]|uniref:Cytochrome P450-cam n=1 Tax=Luminiphilus syltensis NOR5-1B TaxID=565045 RepID=B8KSV6_9GAMM|nr:cytochrome P450 [Luminiphilus syltensis]EED34324.1 cytochrome P450-cam [Luminiphilus syltensis NOR5-1B]
MMQTAAQPDYVADDAVVDFDMYAQSAIADGFHAAWDTLKAPGTPAIMWTPRNEGHWIVTDPALFSEVYNDWELFSSRTIIIPKSHGEAHNLIPTTMDPPVHQPFRMILNRLLAPPVMARISDEVRARTRALVEELAPRGECDFTADFAQALPLHVFMTLMDLPIEDIDQLKYWSDQTTHPDGSMTFEEAIGKLGDYLAPYIAERQANPGSDFISNLVNADIDGKRISDDEASKLSVQLLIAGVDTVVNFLNFAFLRLARDPDLRERIINRELASRDAAEQLLAELPLVTVGRLVTRDCEFHGAPLKAGDMIALPTPLCAGFELPKEQMASNANAHLTFGQGPHMCPGRYLARMEIALVLEEWLALIPRFDIAPDSSITFGGGIVGNIAALPLVWNPAP